MSKKVKIKGAKKLNKVIGSQFKDFGISRLLLSDEFAFYFSDGSITYKLTEDMGDKFFTDFVRDRFNFETDYPFILSLLHEVGHSKANEEINGDIYIFCQKEKTRIEKIVEKSHSLPEIQKMDYQYFNLPDEIMATQWAINYMKKHPKKVKKMWKKMNNAIQKFYKKNLDEG